MHSDRDSKTKIEFSTVFIHTISLTLVCSNPCFQQLCKGLGGVQWQSETRVWRVHWEQCKRQWHSQKWGPRRQESELILVHLNIAKYFQFVHEKKIFFFSFLLKLTTLFTWISVKRKTKPSIAISKLKWCGLPLKPPCKNIFGVLGWWSCSSVTQKRSLLNNYTRGTEIEQLIINNMAWSAQQSPSPKRLVTQVPQNQNVRLVICRNQTTFVWHNIYIITFTLQNHNYKRNKTSPLYIYFTILTFIIINGKNVLKYFCQLLLQQ